MGTTRAHHQGGPQDHWGLALRLTTARGAEVDTPAIPLTASPLKPMTASKFKAAGWISAAAAAADSVAMTPASPTTLPGRALGFWGCWACPLAMPAAQQPTSRHGEVTAGIVVISRCRKLPHSGIAHAIMPWGALPSSASTALDHACSRCTSNTNPQHQAQAAENSLRAVALFPCFLWGFPSLHLPSGAAHQVTVSQRRVLRCHFRA